MRADKGQFDEVLRRMIGSNPKRTAEIKHANPGDQRGFKFRRKKNPHVPSGIETPHWVVDCKNCGSEFVFAVQEAEPEGGNKACPKCGMERTYTANDLQFRTSDV